MGSKKPKKVTGQSQITPQQQVQQTQLNDLIVQTRQQEAAALAAQTEQYATAYQTQLGLIQQQTQALQEQRQAQLQRDLQLQQEQAQQQALIDQQNKATELRTSQALGRSQRDPARMMGILTRQTGARDARQAQTRQVRPRGGATAGLFNTY